MKIGILVNDHVPDQFRHISGDYSDMFQLLLGRDDVELVAFDVIGGDLPTDPTACDAWIATGSLHSVNDDEQWIRSLEQFVREVASARVPYIGICFGHQMLAKALGGKVEKSERGWGVGVHQIEVSEEVGLGDSYRVIHNHQDQVIESPADAEILGWSEHCPISMFVVGETLVGIQGHPEFVPEYSEALLSQRRGHIIPEETVDSALASLQDETDSKSLADWILDFIERARRV